MGGELTEQWQEITMTPFNNGTKNGLDVISQPGTTVKDDLSSSTPLTAGSTFTSTWEERRQPEMLIAFAADQNATISAQFSVDGVNVDSTVSYMFEAGVVEAPHRLVIARKYYRLNVQNTSASDMTYMRLQISVGQFGFLTSALNANVGQDADAIVVRAVDSEIDIASGKYVGFSIVNKFGFNSDVDSAGNEDIWEGGGFYTGFATAAEQLRISSSDAADTSAGTGARTIRIVGLDADYNVINETVTLNGTSNVTTTQSFIRAHTASIQSVGSGGVNAGTITVRQNVTTANIMLSMQIGRNQTNCSAYTVPAGFTAYMRYLHVACGNAANVAIAGNIWTRSFGGVFRSRRPFFVGDNFRLADTIYGGLVFTEKSDIVLRVNTCSANNTPVNGGYDLLLVKN